MVAFPMHVDSIAAVMKRKRSQPGRLRAETRRERGAVASKISRAAAAWVALAGLVPFAGFAASPDSGSEPAGFEPSTTETWEIPQPHLYGVDAVGDDVWAVGYWGTVLRSGDRGETWTRPPTPTDESLYEVAFADANTGWAVGAAGTLLHSRNGGRSWEAVKVEVSDFMGGTEPLRGALFGVAAISPNEAWAVGDFGVVLHTRNGVHWQQLVIPPESFADENIPERIFNAVRFSDRQHGIIAGEFGTVLRTEDGGETWIGEKQFEGAIDDIYLFDVAQNGEGVAVSSGVGGVCIRTEDQGYAWTAARTLTTAGLFAAAIHDRRALLAGDRGVLLLSSDAGVTWREPARPRFFNWLKGVTFAGPDLAFAVGEHGLVVRSTDGGERWEWKLGRQPGPEAGVSVPDPGARSKPTGRETERAPVSE